MVNYKEEDFSEKYKDKPFDLVIDPIGGIKTLPMSPYALPGVTWPDRVLQGEHGLTSTSRPGQLSLTVGCHATHENLLSDCCANV